MRIVNAVQRAGPETHAERANCAIEKNRLEGTRRQEPPHSPSDLGPEATKNVSTGLNGLLADVFALQLKTKNLHLY
jgi:hypothetical protein